MIKYYISRVSANWKKRGLFFTFNKIASFLISIPTNKIINIYFMFVKKDTFIFNKVKLYYFRHTYNITYNNERIIEIPIALNFIKNIKHKNVRILEVGNVLGNYNIKCTDVLDKYDLKSKKVINDDVVNFKPSNKYNYIISISTLEHVGWDENTKDKNKILKSIRNLKEYCLADQGEFLFTVPFGYNPNMDNIIFNNNKKNYKCIFDEMYYLKRISSDNKWIECDYNSVKNYSYGKPFNDANAIFVGLIKKSNGKQ